MTYVYTGEVYAFDSLVASEWRGKTTAVSQPKAIANLKYRFRREFRLAPYVPLYMPGKFNLMV